MRHFRSFFFRHVLLLPVIALTLFAGEVSNAAVSFTVTPSTMDAGSLAPVTLQITGVAAGSTVVIQKFIDYNGNGVVDANDLMIQSFQVTDNHAVVFGGVTNTAVPGDLNPANGAITIALNAGDNGLPPYFSGKFVYRLSSPSGAFTAISKPFTANNTTNSSAGTITGRVTYNGAAVSNATVLVLTRDSGYSSVAGGLANSTGNFTVKVPAGQYVLGAFMSNYVVNIKNATVLNIVAGQKVTNNLTMTKVGQAISGKLYDTNSNAGLGGFGIYCSSTNGYLALGFTVAGGAFSVPVNSGSWEISANGRALNSDGYLRTQNKARVTTTGSGASGVNIAVPKATAMIFGRVLDNFGNPVAGVETSSTDDQDGYEAKALTDVNGYFYLGASSSNNWSASISSPQLAGIEYVFAESYAPTNLAAGGALEEDFGAIAAPYTISGYVYDSTNGAIAGVDVSAYGVINGSGYQTVSSETDSSGHYSINVAGNTTWTVQVADTTGDNGGLNGLGYNAVDNESVIIQSQNGQANFYAPPDGFQELDGHVMDSNGSPVIGVMVDANASGYTNLTATTDNNGFYEFYVGDGNWNVAVNCTNLEAMGYTNCPPEQDNIGVGGFGQNTSGIDFVVNGVATTAPAPAPFFTGQIPAGNNVYSLTFTNGTFFGYYTFTGYPVFYHFDLGYEYFFDANDAGGDAYFYDFTSGHFFYTGPTLWPYLYDFSLTEWLYYFQNSNNNGQRYFGIVGTTQVISE